MHADSIVGRTAWEVRRRIAGPLLRQLCRRSGVAVKLGQMLASRSDLFDKRTIAELSSLQSRHDPLDYATVAGVCFADDFLKATIDEIDEVPLG